MTWDDIYNTLIDGTAEEMLTVSCPECGGTIKYFYDDAHDCFDIVCASCGSRCNCYFGSESDLTPNCVVFFGAEAILNKDAKLLQIA